jgi:hypothetical protein
MMLQPGDRVCDHRHSRAHWWNLDDPRTGTVVSLSEGWDEDRGLLPYPEEWSAHVEVDYPGENWPYHRPDGSVSPIYAPDVSALTRVDECDRCES